MFSMAVLLANLSAMRASKRRQATFAICSQMRRRSKQFPRLRRKRAGLASRKFREYVQETIHANLSASTPFTCSFLRLLRSGSPQRRRRIFFVGLRNKDEAARFEPPTPTHTVDESYEATLPRTMGAREALGLPEMDFDALAPTIRSGLNRPPTYYQRGELCDCGETVGSFGHLA